MPGEPGRHLCEQGVLQVKDHEMPKPSEATGTAALRAGWSHGHRDVSGGWLRPTVFGAVDGLVHAEVALERRMLAQFPAAEEEELAGYFRSYGADPETAARMATAVSQDPGTALRVHTREELGVDPNELPSPILAGLASLLAFSLGALVPLLPYLVGLPVLTATLGITAVALITGGMIVGRLTGRSMVRSGLRQLALGGLAIGVTFAVGSLIGSGVT